MARLSGGGLPSADPRRTDRLGRWLRAEPHTEGELLLGLCSWLPWPASSQAERGFQEAWDPLPSGLLFRVDCPWVCQLASLGSCFLICEMDLCVDSTRWMGHLYSILAHFHGSVIYIHIYMYVYIYKIDEENGNSNRFHFLGLQNQCRWRLQPQN